MLIITLILAAYFVGVFVGFHVGRAIRHRPSSPMFACAPMSQEPIERISKVRFELDPETGEARVRQ
jgi:hypothetical protein